MKNIIMVVALTLTVAACGGASDGGNSSEVSQQETPTCSGFKELGTWMAGPDTLDLKSDCTGTSTMCESKFTFRKTAPNWAELNVTQTNSNPGCLPIGKSPCMIEVIGNTLSVDCGAGALIYTK